MHFYKTINQHVPTWNHPFPCKSWDEESCTKRFSTLQFIANLKCTMINPATH